MVALRLCRLDEVVDGAARLCEARDEESSVVHKILVIREGETVRGFRNVCPHFGVPLAQRQEHLIHEPGVSLTCNTHYARFRWSDGYCIRGECMGESLQAVTLVTKGAWVELLTE